MEYLKYYYCYYPKTFIMCLMFLVVLVLIEILVGIFGYHKLKKKICWTILATVYMYLLILITLVYRIPFKGDHVILRSEIVMNFRITYENVLNALLFAPLGVLQYHYLSKKKANDKWWLVALRAASLSIIIEITQLGTNRGYFELDDIIFNTSGCLASYCIYRKMIKLYI